MTDNGNAYRSRYFRDACVRAPAWAPSAYQALHAAPQQQGPALFKTVMRECTYALCLPAITGAGRDAALLAAHLQRAPAAYRPRWTTTDQPTRHEEPA
jgi:hypothetical protein